MTPGNASKKGSSRRNNIAYQAQDILSRRDHSEHEIRQKLQRKGFTLPVIDDIVAKLKQQRLVDDQLFAERYVASILQGKAVGPRWLQHKLRQRGVASSISSRVIAAAFTTENERAVAQRALATWQRLHPTNQTDDEKITRFLMGRGFSYDVITQLLPSDRTYN